MKQVGLLTLIDVVGQIIIGFVEQVFVVIRCILLIFGFGLAF